MKIRPVVVISPRRRSSLLVTVIPLSSTAPVPVHPWHWPVPRGVYPPARGPMWAKADLVQTVALDRLDRIRTKNAAGQRGYQTYQLTQSDLADLIAAVKAALGIR